MDLLEDIYEHPPALKKAISRKLLFENNKTLIASPKYSGALEWVLEAVEESEVSSFIYIDLNDFRVENLNARKLNDFIKQERIEFVCIENYTPNFGTVEAEKILLITEEKTDLPGYETAALLPLDFEEFLSLRENIKSIEDLFDDFFKHGGLPSLINLEDEERVKRAAELLKLLFPSRSIMEIFKFFILKTGFSFSLFQAFNLIKQEIKLSKDFFYKTIEDLENKNYIFSVEKFGSSRSPKKFYPYDFVFRHSLTYKKDLAKNFEHMIFLELKKRNFEIYYMDFIDFYIPSQERIILTLPFLTYEQLLVKSTAALSSKRAQNLEIVTLGYEYDGEVLGTRISAKPFWEWALGQ